MKRIEFISDNLDGITRMLVIPSDDVYEMRTISKNIYAVTFNKDKAIELPVINRKKFVCTENLMINDGGKVYKTVISGVIATRSSNNLALIDELVANPVVIIYCDGNNDWHVAGNKTTPLYIKYKQNTAGVNEYVIDAEGYCLDPIAGLYNPDYFLGNP